MSYIGVSPFTNTVRTVTRLTANGSANTFYPDGGYTKGYIDVFLEGNKKVETVDYTASDTLSVVFGATPANGDVIEFITYRPVSLTVVDWNGINNKPDPQITLAGDATGNVILNDLTSNTLTLTLANTTVVANAYGNSSQIPVITVDSKGRITNATTTAVAGVTGFSYSGANNTFSITTGDGSTFKANISANSISALALGSSGVVANVYGNSTAIPVITVDEDGRISNATTTSVSGVTGVSYTTSNSTITVSTSIANYDAVVNSGNSTVQGLLQIVDSVSNSSATVAASANSVKVAYELAGNAVSNAVSYSSTAYSNAASYADTVSGTAYTNAVSQATTLAGNAYTNAVSQATTLAGNAYTNATSFAANADNISSGTLSGARIQANNGIVGNTSGVFVKAGTGVVVNATGVHTSQDISNTANVTFGYMTITGNLVVQGTTTTVNTVTLSVQDNMIYLNSNSTVTNPDLGFAGNYNDGTYAHAGFFRDTTDGRWKIFDSYLPEPDAAAYIDTANASFHLSDFQANVVYANLTGNVTGNVSGSANSATYLGGNTAGDLRSYSDTTSGTSYTNAVSQATTLAGTAYTNAVSQATTLAGTSYTNAVSQATTLAGTAYTNAVSQATTLAGTAYTNAVSIASSDATTKAGTAYSNAVSYAGTIAGTAYTNAVSTASSDATTKAGTAYSNAVSYAATIAGTAYSNAVSVAASDATTKAGTAYSNAISYAATIAGTAYSNAVSYAASIAGTAYSNAVSYAAANSYVNSTFLPLAGGTMTGSIANGTFTSQLTVAGRTRIYGAGIADIASTGNDIGIAFGAGILYPTDGALNLTNNTKALGSSSYTFSSLYLGTAAYAPLFYDISNTGYYVDPASTSTINALTSYGNINNYQAIGAADDVRIGITAYDTSSVAANVGGQIVLGYQYTSAGDYTQGAIIKMYKLNGTSGDYSSGLKFQVRDNGEALATRVWITPSGSLVSDYEMRAPVFYDNDNTGYYVNPAATSVMNSISQAGVYSRHSAGTGWLSGNYSSSEAVNTTGAIYSIGGSYVPTSTSFNNMYGIGYCYADGISVGISGASGWGQYVNGNGTNKVWLGGESGQVISTGEHRGTIFYDYSDTNYYVDPASTTVLNALNAVTKSFLIDHPTKQGKKLRYACLEGPENGVYVRGKLVGDNMIELPEYWTKLVDPDSITVSLTPIGGGQKLCVWAINNNSIIVHNEVEGGAIKCFYVVYGERVDVDKLEVEV